MTPVFAALALVSLAEWKQWQCEGQERIVGRYVNFARAFSVEIPKEFPARRSIASGPEVGVPIPLASDCAAVIVVFAEPNSLEWRSPRDAIDWRVRLATDTDAVEPTIHKARLGRLRASAVTLRHTDSDDIEEMVIAFGPKTGLVYTARLATTRSRLATDKKIFDCVLRSFRTEPWR